MSNNEHLIRVHRGHQLLGGLPSPGSYFLPRYEQAASMAENGEWFLLEAHDGTWHVPLILRTMDNGAKDAITPYGYTGVYASQVLPSSQVQGAWSATFNALRELGAIRVLLRHSPLIPQAPDLPQAASIISSHPTIVLEPTDSDAAWKSVESRCRNQTLKAIKTGYTGAVKQVTAQDLAPGGEFRRLYEQTTY